jgi:MoaA/NifB/PqqE/SkfB family radical SAM enzyme
MSTASAFRKNNRSAFTNFLQAKYEAYTGEIHVNSTPYYLCVDPSDICQLRCPTCPTGVENESKRGNLSDRIIYRGKRALLGRDLFDAVLDELGEQLFLIMFYNYGEPLLNKNLPEYIRKADALDIETEIHTNLSLKLSDQEIEDLLTSGLGSLNASIDGFSQESYQIHRVGGDVELVKSNLERLVKARDRLGLHTYITYKFLVFSFNEHEVPAARQFCEDRGINFIYGDAFIQNPDWLPSHRKGQEPYYSETDIQMLLSQWEAAGKPNYWKEHEKRPLWSVLSKAQEANLPSFCGWHYGFSVLTAGGPVAPCCAAAKEEDDFGKVIPGEVGFREIWNNDRYRKSRAAFAGRDVPGLAGVDTVCVRCYFPKFVQHLYSLHDQKVINQFKRVFNGTDPVLERAFALLEGDPHQFVDFFQKESIDLCQRT